MIENIEQLIGDELRERGWRLAVAESCTGGLIGHRITNNSGSSTYYLGSITAYAYRAKVRLLGVSWDTLEDYGAVSEETVEEMALGVRHALAADIGLSVSGIAGPTGGSRLKPAGLVYISTFVDGDVKTCRNLFQADRSAIRNQSIAAALDQLKNCLIRAICKKGK